MKKILLVIVILLSLCLDNYANNEIKVLQEKNNSITISLKFNDFKLRSVGLIDGVEHYIVHADNSVRNLTYKAPDLPKLNTAIQLFERGKTHINIIKAIYVDYPNIEIAPSKGNLYRNIDPDDIPYVKGDDYNQNSFYPGYVAKLRDPFVFRSVRGQVVEFIPVQYNPVTKVMRVYKEIEIDVINDLKLEGFNEITESKVFVRSIHDINARRFINYLPTKYTPVEENGKMLIICKDALMSDMDNFVNWKIKKGIPTEIISINDIGNNQTSIDNFVDNYYQENPEMTYLLLVGDHADVKCYNAGSTGSETKWSDSKYGLISNDWYPDIFVGRFSASNSQNLEKILERNMEYEVQPLAGDWYKKAIGLGSDEGQGFGDDGEADWQHLRNIRTDLLNFGFTEVFEFYDGSHGGADASSNPNASQIINAVNSGVTLFNYTGHGDLNTFISGNFGSSSVNSATNEGKYPFVISVACNNGTFTSGSCLSEAWQLAYGTNRTTGSIAICGSSILMSWAPPMSTQDEVVDILVESYTVNKKFTLGGLFYNGLMQMMDDYGNQGKEVVETWVFFGDPSVMIRTADPIDLTASHVTQVLVGANSLEITSCNQEGALICLTQDNEILGTGIVVNGTVSISVDPIVSLNDINVVATAYNCRPYQGTVDVVEEITASNPNTSNSLLINYDPYSPYGLYPLSMSISFNGTYTDGAIYIYNSLGQVIKQTNLNSLANGSCSNCYDLTNVVYYLRSGIYSIEVIINEQKLGSKFFVTRSM